MVFAIVNDLWGFELLLILNFITVSFVMIVWLGLGWKCRHFFTTERLWRSVLIFVRA